MSNEKKSSPERDAARAAALQDDPNLDAVRVKYKGAEYEVRAPSYKQIKDVERYATHDGKLDDGEQMFRLLIECTYTPTGERVFEAADLQTMLQRPSTAMARLTKALGLPLTKLTQALTLEEEEKNSESAPT